MGQLEPNGSSSSDNEESPGNSTQNRGNIPGRAEGEGLGKGPKTVNPIPRSKSTNTAPAQFTSGPEWREYCIPPAFYGWNDETDKMLVRITTTQFFGKQGPQSRPFDGAAHASITLRGTPQALSSVLRIWTGHSNLRKLAHFSRTWLGPDSEPEQREKVQDAVQYSKALQEWYKSNEDEAVMSFPYPWKMDSCGCYSVLRKPTSDKDPFSPVSGQSISTTKDLQGVTLKGILQTPTVKRVRIQLTPETSRRPSPPDSEDSSDREEEAIGVGTDLALSISHNLLMLAKYHNASIPYLDFCNKEVVKVMQAPPGIQESILNPLHRPDKEDPYPGLGARRYPSNPRNTLRGLPRLGPAIRTRVGQKCNRCEKGDVLNVLGHRLRPVTNLGDGPGLCLWEGLPENSLKGSTAFLCSGCIFPSCSRNQDHQYLEYTNGQFQAAETPYRTENTTPPDGGPKTPEQETEELPSQGAVGHAGHWNPWKGQWDYILPKSKEPDMGFSWGDSSDDSEFTFNRQRKGPLGSQSSTPAAIDPYTPLSFSSIAKQTRNARFNTPEAGQNSYQSPLPADTNLDEGKAWSTSSGQTVGKTSGLERLKMMDVKYKIKSNIDKTWTSMVPMFAGKYGDIKALAKFGTDVKDALRREGLFEDCIEAGIPLSELLHRLLVLRLEPASVIARHLKPVWDKEDWRAKHFGDLGCMMRFLIRNLLDKTALSDAEVAFTSFRRLAGESAIELLIRLRETYETACLEEDFPIRIPEHMLPERMVRSLDNQLQIRVIDGLGKSCRPWRREKLEKEKRTSPDQIRMILTKVQQEIDTQLAVWNRVVRPGGVSFKDTPANTSSGKPFTNRWGRTPYPKRSETAYPLQDETMDTDCEYEPSDEDTEKLRTVGGPPPRKPFVPFKPFTPGKPPVGLLGPPVPEFSRYPRGPPGPRPPTPNSRPRTPPDESKRGRYTLGDVNYSGCHNCGDKQHMARDCTKPLSQKLAALVQSHTGWPDEDVQSLLEQGLPTSLEEYWDNPEEIRQYCLEISEFRKKGHQGSVE